MAVPGPEAQIGTIRRAQTTRKRGAYFRIGCHQKDDTKDSSVVMKSDIEIAQAATLKPIQDIAAGLGIDASDLIPYGHDKAKISADFVARTSKGEDGKLVLVTAVSPTPAGEGKTTTTVGLGDAMNLLGRKTVICLREPRRRPSSPRRRRARNSGRGPPKVGDESP